MRRHHLIVTDRPAACGCDCNGDPHDPNDCCGEPGWVIRRITMTCEDIPAMYPAGTWRRGGGVITSSACPRHLIEWASEIVAQWPPERPTIPQRTFSLDRRNDSSHSDINAGPLSNRIIESLRTSGYANF